ncbi:2-hydroxyacid dehydrogenase [Olivibacter ginsenosidimutans]|uniref:2-hydroxyacid dehydrogenase n=1 Tax=Olivibacter ginsenosidimutans TaxID=1176537 RepID=A0ABP9BZ85_9SPHI
MTDKKETAFHWKILIVDDIHPIFLEQLNRLGATCTYLPDIDLDGALAILSDYDVLVIRSKFKVDAEVLKVGKKLQCIARAGAGMDNIDEQLATDKKIQLLNAPEGNCDAVAEHALGMLLSLMNNLPKGDKEIRTGLWKRESNRGIELGGKTVALIGYGNNGQATARKLSGFGVRIIAYDKYKTGFSDGYVQEVSMEQVVKEADVLSLHIPLTRETRNLVNREYLFHFRKPIFFLNTSRGEIVDVDAVLENISQGKILGAAFDVLPIEKFPALQKTSWYEKLIASDNVLLSPHVAGWSVESYYKIAAVLANKLIHFISTKG